MAEYCTSTQLQVQASKPSQTQLQVQASQPSQTLNVKHYYTCTLYNCCDQSHYPLLNKSTPTSKQTEEWGPVKLQPSKFEFNLFAVKVGVAIRMAVCGTK